MFNSKNKDLIKGLDLLFLKIQMNKNINLGRIVSFLQEFTQDGSDLSLPNILKVLMSKSKILILLFLFALVYSKQENKVAEEAHLE